MKSSYCASMRTWSVLSGDGEYFHSVLKSSRVSGRAAMGSILREVVGGLVDAGTLLLELHQEVVREGARAEAEPVGVEPAGAERFAQHHEVGDGELRFADATCGFHADASAGRVEVIADRLQHHERHRQRRGRLDLARRGLDEIGAGMHGEETRTAHAIERAELAGLENHLEVCRAACLLDGD